MSDELIVTLLILVITIAMMIVSMVFNKFWGVKREFLVELREKFSNLQERMNNAQILGDVRQMRQLQLEANQILKSMMYKQYLPLCLRCSLFLIVFAILSFIFSGYEWGLLPFNIPLLGSGWFALYFLFSLGFSLLIFGSKLLYRKVTGKGNKKGSSLRQIINELSLKSSNTMSGGGSLTFDASEFQSSLQKDNYLPSNENIDSSDGWKDKIQD
ncbi:MAG: hypothetical protein ACFFBP_02795 [Promethearchaeota archaeon]